MPGPTRGAAHLFRTSREEAWRHACHGRSRDSKFVAGFDTVFTTDGTEVIRTPIAVPNANAQVAEPPRVSANGRRRGALLRELGRSGVAVEWRSFGGAGFLGFGRAA
jgi:hypothetical protein